MQSQPVSDADKGFLDPLRSHYIAGGVVSPGSLKAICW
jgi:hypothetical protein